MSDNAVQSKMRPQEGMCNVTANANLPASRSFTTGVVFLLLAAALWSLNGALINLIYAGGQGPQAVSIAFFRSLVAGLFLLPITRGRWATLLIPRQSGGGRRIRRAMPTCAILFTLMTVSFVLANTMTKSANAVILQYTSTFWVFLLSPIVLREHPHARDLPFLVLAMIGVGVIFAGNMATDFVGLVIALASGVFFGLLTISIRLLRDANSAVVAVFINLAAALLLLPVCLTWGSLLLAPRECMLLIFMGVVQFGIPYYLYSAGLARVPAHHAALLTMLEPVLVPVWTYLAVGQTVPSTTIAGGVMILFALMFFVLAAQRRSRVLGESTA